jgi:hypothetical protein
MAAVPVAGTTCSALFASPQIRNKRRRTVDRILRIGIALAIAAASIGLIGCMTASVSVSKDESSEAQESDKQIEEWLSEPDKAEARKWLESDSHILFEGDRKTAGRVVSDLYSAGATEVWIIGITQFRDAEVAAAFVAVLPSDTASRKRVFAVESDFQKLIGGDASNDAGQKYLHFTFD